MFLNQREVHEANIPIHSRFLTIAISHQHHTSTNALLPNSILQSHPNVFICNLYVSEQFFELLVCYVWHFLQWQIAIVWYFWLYISLSFLLFNVFKFTDMDQWEIPMNVIIDIKSYNLIDKFQFYLKNDRIIIILGLTLVVD